MFTYRTSLSWYTIPTASVPSRSDLFYKPTEYTLPVINMYDIISHLNPVSLFSVICSLFELKAFQVNPDVKSWWSRVITDFIAVGKPSCKDFLYSTNG